MNRISKVLFLIFCIMPCEPSSADEVPTNWAVLEGNILGGKEHFNSDVGYILITVPTILSSVLLRVPDDKTIKRQFNDAQAAYMKLNKADRQAISAEEFHKIFEKSNPIDLYDIVQIRYEENYSKAVSPGEYIYYGNINLEDGMYGHCLCMGTVRFKVNPGVFTNLNNVIFSGFEGQPWSGLNDKSWAGFKDVKDSALLEKSDGVIPASIRTNGWKIVDADMHAQGKLDNYFGINISRIKSIDGIINYRRDRVIDGKTGLELNYPASNQQQPH